MLLLEIICIQLEISFRNTLHHFELWNSRVLHSFLIRKQITNTRVLSPQMRVISLI